MKVQLHLVSAPLPIVTQPSAQIGCLKSYIDRELGAQVKVYSHSAHFEIFNRAERKTWPTLFESVIPYGECIYMLLYYDKFILPDLKGAERVPLSKYLQQLNRTQLNRYGVNIGKKHKLGPLQEEDLRRLGSCTMEYIEDDIIPKLNKDGVNIIGFTLNAHQIYASIFMEKYIREKSGQKNLVFLYGGYSAVSPQGLYQLHQLEATGYSVVGEGEVKLRQIIQQFLNLDSKTPQNHPITIDGVIRVKDFHNPIDLPNSYFKSQLTDMSQLPLPDFDEFQDKYEAAIKVNPFLRVSGQRPIVPVEGTRGCFAHCDFCSLNAQWRGFRKLPADLVFERTLKLVEKYSPGRAVSFLDNVCDTWAERFAELVIERNVEIHFNMELRAHHPEYFWTKLAIAGLKVVQIGIEAFSPSLLKKIGKGTRAIQNLVAQKCFRELGVSSESNIIVHHPKSTLAEVEETQEILAASSHFSIVRLIDYQLESNSPIYKSLSKAEQAHPTFKSLVKFKGPLKNHLGDPELVLPKSLRLDKKTTTAWDELRKWYERKEAEWAKYPPRLSVEHITPGTLLIKDFRKRPYRKFTLMGDSAKVYDACHSGPSFEAIQKRTSVPEKKLQLILKKLIEKNLVLQIDGAYLSLALRPKEELLANLRLRQPDASQSETP